MTSNPQVISSSDWAFAWGTESLVLVPQSGGPRIYMQGKGMSILRRPALPAAARRYSNLEPSLHFFFFTFLAANSNGSSSPLIGGFPLPRRARIRLTFAGSARRACQAPTVDIDASIGACSSPNRRALR